MSDDLNQMIIEPIDRASANSDWITDFVAELKATNEAVNP